MKDQKVQHILQITLCDFPPEIRVVKEGISLQKAGFSSAVLCPPMLGRPEKEVWNGIHIFRPKILAKAHGFFDKFLFQSFFFSPSWYLALHQVIAEYKPDVLHVHDIWLGRTVFSVHSGQKVVIDLHENMPAAVVEYLKGYRGFLKWFNALFKNQSRVLSYERKMLNLSDKVFTVVEEAQIRVLLNHPLLPSEKVENIENLESKYFITKTDTQQAVFGKDHFSVLYIGGFGPHRGIETLINSMVYIKQWGLNVCVQLIGARPSQYFEILKELIYDLGVDKQINITGWLPNEKVLSNIMQADVGCVPHHSNPHTDNTIPHKLFQYMIAQTPVLVSSSRPLARTVRQANAGLIFRASDAEDCAKKIREMYNDRIKLKTYAENGYRYVMEMGHNWEEESAPKLIQVYNDLLKCTSQD